MAHHYYVFRMAIVTYFVLWILSTAFAAPIKDDNTSNLETNTSTVEHSKLKSESSNCRHTRSQYEDRNCTASLPPRNIRGKFPMCNTNRVQKMKVRIFVITCYNYTCRCAELYTGFLCFIHVLDWLASPQE